MKTAVIIPCYKCKDTVLPIIDRIPKTVEKIYLVDDACPEKTGEHTGKRVKDRRVKILVHDKNKGVGAAVTTGYKEALKDGMEVLVKLDGDGQMHPELIPDLVKPILSKKADYAKGNRFYSPRHLKGMPMLRLLGNSALSFISKCSTGYWQVMDPNNGFTAIHAAVLKQMGLEDLSERFFFETDMLYRLNLARAVVVDVPMKAVYGDEGSNLRIRRALVTFFVKHIATFFKRVIYMYVIRDFNLGSLEALGGAAFTLFGAAFGGIHWYVSYQSSIPATSGTVMIAGLSLIVGFQLLLMAALYDISNTFTTPLQDLI